MDCNSFVKKQKSHMKVINDKSEELDHREHRKRKLDALRKIGQTFPNDFKQINLASEICNKHNSKDANQLKQEKNIVQVAGRIMIRHLIGKASFIQLQDRTGRIQLYLRRQNMKNNIIYDEFKTWDIGDIIGASGILFKTNTGELTIKVNDIKLLTKSLRPLPDKWHGLIDQETRYRQRYLDLIVNEKSRQVFHKRIKIIQIIRDFFIKLNFLEVETPMMHVIPGGATARPFVTHHNTLDMDLYLRIAPELYLKRLVVGGFERVFEINRNFRNEGLSSKHNPEFTMLEFYQAYANYTDLMVVTENLIKILSKKILGTLNVTYQGNILDLAKPFECYTIIESLLHFNSYLKSESIMNRNSLSLILQDLNIKVPQSWGLGKCQFALFEATVEDKLINPTFITEFPTEISPLARKNNNNPKVTDRFELFIAGREIANGFSELNDPEDQKERFITQISNKNSDDIEAMHYDYDYIKALEYGLPPTAGEGIGIDRLVMLLTNSPSIRDVLLFPHMRPK